MRITVSGRHTDVPESLKTYAEEKAAKLQRFYDRVSAAEVVFDVVAGKNICEIVSRADHHTTFVAKEEHADPFASLDAAVKDIERQLSRHKDRLRNRKHLGPGDREPMGGPDSDQTQGEDQ